jgi:hypothetical protein
VSNNIITPEIETESAIWAAGTRYTKESIVKGYRAYAEACGEDALDIQRFCEQILGIDPYGNDTALVRSVKTDRHGITTVHLEWHGVDDHVVYEFDLNSIGNCISQGGNLRSGWVVVDGEVKVKSGDRVRLINS